MAADFTFGNWDCNYIESKNKGCIITANGKYIATVQKNGDARLISAAPKMYGTARNAITQRHDTEYARVSLKEG